MINNTFYVNNPNKNIKEKMLFYKSDLKYKKHNNFNLEDYKINNPDVNELYGEDMDTLQFRLNDCLKTGGLVLDISHLDLEELPDIPNSVKQLYCSDNDLIDISKLKYLINLQVLDISNNKINKLPNFHPNLKELSCKNNYLTNIDTLSSCPLLKRLDCSYNKITHIPILNNLQILVCNNNIISKIENLYKLHRLVCSYNNIHTINNLFNLKNMECNNNLLDNIKNHPKLLTLYCENNKIKKLENLDSIKICCCYKNNISKLDYFKTLDELYCDKNINKISSKYSIHAARVDKKGVLYIAFKNNI
jgi:Leucine-rich repeat (LRR) protein